MARIAAPGSLSVLLLLTSLGAEAAGPSASSIRAKYRVSPPPAGRSELAPGSARPYLEARRALARGRPTAALEALSEPHGDLFADREALLRGDALLALGELEGAQSAYREALVGALVPSVARRASQGLAEAYARLGATDAALAHLDALLHGAKGEARARLLLARARALAEAGRAQPALDDALEVIRLAPASDAADTALQIAGAMERKGAKRRPSSPAERLARALALIDARALDAAEEALAELDPKAPAVRFARARLLIQRGDEKGAEEALEALAGPEVADDVAAEALDQLARRRFRGDDNEGALALFERLAKRAPGSTEARRAAYLAGWIHYDAGRYGAATGRMLDYARRYPRDRHRDEALWYAGWSSYLGSDHDEAKAAFRKLLEEHGRSSLATHAHYWLGRIALKEEAPELAKASFRSVLEREPLGYYALWARRRLEALGETVIRPARPEELSEPVTIEAALAALGPTRPVTIDRAILLHREDRHGEAFEELQSSQAALGRAGGAEARIRVADLLHRLGAHYLAFRAAHRLTRSGAELFEGEETAWRAWQHAYPRAFEPAVRAAEKTHEVASEMVWAIMRTESHYRPWVRSPVGARGLMQLMPATARQIGREAKGGRAHSARHQRPESNIWLGTWYLGQLLERYGGQVVAAVGAYNGGPTAMDAWLHEFDGMALDEFVERIPYRETRRYVRRVIETWSIYQQLYGGEAPELPSAIHEVVDPSSRASF